MQLQSNNINVNLNETEQVELKNSANQLKFLPIFESREAQVHVQPETGHVELLWNQLR